MTIEPVRGRRRLPDGPPVIPGRTVASILVRLNEEETREMQQYAQGEFPGRPRRQDRPAAPVPSVGGFETDSPIETDALVPWERALDMIKNVVVILTCAVLLYTLWWAYNAVAELGDALRNFPL